MTPPPRILATRYADRGVPRTSSRARGSVPGRDRSAVGLSWSTHGRIPRAGRGSVACLQRHRSSPAQGLARGIGRASDRLVGVLRVGPSRRSTLAGPRECPDRAGWAPAGARPRSRWRRRRSPRSVASTAQGVPEGDDFEEDGETAHHLRRCGSTRGGGEGRRGRPGRPARRRRCALARRRGRPSRGRGGRRWRRRRVRRRAGTPARGRWG